MEKFLLKTPTASLLKPELSDYEKVRVENIKRNEEFLNSLGLGSPNLNNKSVNLRNINLNKAERKKRKSEVEDDSEEENADIVNHKKKKNIQKKEANNSYQSVRRSSRLDPELLKLPVSDEKLKFLIDCGHNEVRARKALLLCKRNDENKNNEGSESIEEELKWIEKHQYHREIDNPHFMQHEEIDHLDKMKNKSRNAKDTTSEIKEMQIEFDEGIERCAISSPSNVREFMNSMNISHSRAIGNEEIIHCVNRIHSMTNKQLANRIKFISTGKGNKSFLKLLVFYYCLILSGLYDLATAAKTFLYAKFHFDVETEDIEVEEDEKHEEGEVDEKNNEKSEEKSEEIKNEQIDVLREEKKVKNETTIVIEIDE